MTLPSPKDAAAALLVVVNATIALLVGLAIVSWTDVQVALVLATANTGVGLAVAVYAHLKPGTVAEPVAVGVALTAFTTAVLALLVGFQVFTLTDAQIGLVISLETGVVSFVGLFIVRQRTTPVPAKYPPDAIPPANQPTSTAP